MEERVDKVGVAGGSDDGDLNAVVREETCDVEQWEHVAGS